MWSLGIILYQLVSSWEYPFDVFTSNIKYINSIRFGKPATLPASTPTYIKNIIIKLLDKDP